MRFLGLVILCAFISGCATYRPASIPSAEPATGSDVMIPHVAKGDMVRITLQSGAEVSGRVLWLSNEKLALDRGGNYGNEELVLSIAGIDHAEIRNQSEGQLDGRLFLALGVAAAAAIYYGLHHMEF